MTSTEASTVSKWINETSKKSSPLKVVSPIIKKYTGQRQGRIKKKKLELPRKLPGNKSVNANLTKPPLKTILPKTKAGDVIIVESELIPCALNIQSKRKKEETDINVIEIPENVLASDEKLSVNDIGIKSNKAKLNSTAKRKKYFKNIESTFALLKSEVESLKDKREHAFAQNYLQRVQETLKGKDDNLYNQFVDLICDFQMHGMTVIELYKKIKQMFSNHVHLSEDFVAFLTPEQAVECGIFMEHLLLTRMIDFLKMVDIYFSKSPQQIKKIHSVLQTLSMKENVTTEDVKNAITPLLKGSTVLQDYFLQLIPHATPPSNFLIDFEEVEYPELNSDISEDEERYEVVKIREVEEDIFGGDSCPCNCHDSEEDKYKKRINHCTSCLVKYINGKIFIQNGKLLRPAKVTFDDYDIAYHRERLAPKLYPKRERKKSRTNIFKENCSPSKSYYISSDEFKSDIEDDERLKSKLGLCKSPRTGNKKIASPKNYDKNVARSIFSDSKLDNVDVCEKATSSRCTSNVNVKDDKLNKDSSDLYSDHVHDIYDVKIVIGSPVKSGVSKNEISSPSKVFDLPQIDVEESVFDNEAMARPDALQEKAFTSDIKAEIGSSLLVGKEGSKSPPVISIPDSANSSFLESGRPILSFLENLDIEKEPVLLISENDKIIHFDSGSKIVKSPGYMEDRTLSWKEEMEACEEESKDEEKKKETLCPWKIEEDRIILQTLQVEENCEETFRKINDRIPSRSLEDIKKRFATLMNILYEMKAKTSKKQEIN